MYTSTCWYLRVLPVLNRPEVVDIGVKSYIEKNCLEDYRIRSFLSIQYVHGDYVSIQEYIRVPIIQIGTRIYS